MTNTLTPPPIFAFTIAFDDDASTGSAIIVGQFQEVSGISVPIEWDDVAEGGVNRFVYKLPGTAKHANLVLKRGIVPAGSVLARWATQALDGGLAQAIETRTVLMQLLYTSGQPLARWRFADAFPVKWLIDPFQSDKEATAVEMLELAYASFTLLP